MNGLKPYFPQNFLTRQELKTVCAVAFLLLVEWGVKSCSFNQTEALSGRAYN